MASAPPPQDQMGYEALAQDALRGVVRAALKVAASPPGLPGDHHLYISFKTRAVGVSGPPDVLGKYPDEMTIVLQHQFQDLAPGETFFAVTLRFGGAPKRLTIPYSAVTRFYDPSVQFVLQFPPPELEPEAAPPPAEDAAPPGEPGAEPAAPGEEGAKVVSLDQFRKK